MAQSDKTPQQMLQEAIETMKLLASHAPEMATYKRTLYLEYVGVGFSEQQALELVKGLF